MRPFRIPGEKARILTLVLYFPFSILAIETLAHLNLWQGLLLLVRQPFAFLLNTMLFGAIAYFLLAIFRNQKLVLGAMSLISILIGLGTKLKIDFRGVGLNVLDFLILKEAGEMTNNLSESFIIQAVLYSSLILILSLFLILNMPVIRLNPKFRKNGILAFVLLSLFLYFFGPYTITIKSAGIKRKLYIEESGSLYYFAAQIKNTTSLRVPEEDQVRESLAPLLEQVPLNTSTLMPDVVIIQSESFTDPSVLGLDNFSEDPLPYFRALQSQADSFSISVPSFAGGTANSEFEVITGMSTIFYPSDATVFSNYLVKPTVSVGSILKNNGYSATMLHPFHSTFYRRDNAYRLLGFDTFYGLEYLAGTKVVTEDTRYWDAVDDYMTDEMLYSHVLQELEKDTGSPYRFVMGVSMQNHTPFVAPEGYENAVVYVGGKLENTKTLRIYNTYLSSLKASDDALEDFISVLAARKRPTLLLFYGDHYPKVNQNGNAYMDLGLVDDLTTPENDYITHVTPAFIWSNYERPKGSPDTLDASLLLARLFSGTGIQTPNYLKILSLLSQRNINSMTNAYLVMDNTFYFTDSPEYKEIYELYSLLNGDILGGSKFLEEKEWTIPENKTYKNPQSSAP